VIRGFLFDLDGTLVDSERETAEAMARALSRHHGIEIAQYDRDFIIGRSWLAIYDSLIQRYPLITWSRAEMIAKTAALREEVIAELGVRVMPGARGVLEWTRRAHKRGLVTGSSRVDVGRSKPAPDGYHAAMAALGLGAHEVVVIEDSEAGITAGREAGCTVLAVRAGNFGGWKQDHAHRVIDTLDELTPSLVEALGRDYG
jgi:sugar-phosphatase